MITVGKHAAPEGSAVHPLVADALARRSPEGTDAEADPAERSGRVGWPAPPAPGGGGLGWPGEEPAQDRGPRSGAQAQRGWRRLFRLRPAA